jgi:antitoxin component of MazEF toxin-antitoxin module
MKNEVNLIEIRSISKRGGSLSLNVPAEFAKMMDLAVGTPVVFQYNEERKRLVIEKVKAIETDDGRIINILKSEAD